MQVKCDGAMSGVEHVGCEAEGKEGVKVRHDVCSYHEMTPHQRGWQVEQATLRVIVKLNDPVLVFRMLKIS
jgi:hypothetical protein